MKKVRLIAIAVLAVFGLVGSAQAQVQGNTSINVTVNVTQENTISLNVSGGPLVFTPNSSGVPITNSVTFTSSWNLGPANQIILYTFFSNASGALSTSNGANIPASALQATWTNNTPNAAQGSSTGKACNQTYGAGSGVVDGASCERVMVVNVGSGGLNNAGPNNSTTNGANVTYSLSIPAYASGNYGAGSYTGTLNAVIIAS